MKIVETAVWTPYPRITVADANADEEVVVVLTQARIDAGRRGEFDRQTHRLVDSLPNQLGLLGYSVRQQTHGDLVWTLTIWVSGQARSQFLHSAAHRRAVAHSGAAVRDMQAWRATMPRAHIPGSWAEVAAMFADSRIAP